MPPKKRIPDTIAVDVNGKKENKVGGQMNERMPMTIELEDGSKVSGYYTENVYTNFEEKYKQVLDQAIQELRTQHGKENAPGVAFLQEIKEKISLNDFFWSINAVTAATEWSEVENSGLFFGNDEKCRRFFMQLQTRGINIQNTLSLETDQIFMGVMRMMGEAAVGMALNQITLIEQAGIEESKTSNVNRRNNALSEVSELLGHPDLVCKSVKMTTIDGDVQKEGTFMVNAKGVDFKKLSPVQKNGKRISLEYSPAAFRDMSRLQVMDFICGNLDRHSGNYFYDIEFVEKNGKEVMMVKGLQGIDNDLSFGTVKPTGEGITHYMSNLNDIKVIDAEQAGMISRLNPADFENIMRKAGLSRKEIEAGMERLNAIKTRIANAEVRVIDNDEGWLNLDKDALEAEQGTFANIWSLRHDAERKVQNMKNVPVSIEQFKKNVLPKEPAHTMEVKNESSALLFKSQIANLRELKAQLDATNPEKASKEFRSMYNGLTGLLQKIETMSKKANLRDTDYNSLSMGFKDVMKKTENYIKLKPKNPRTGNGKERLHCAKNMLAQLTEGRHMVLEETTAAFNRKMTAEFNNFNINYKALIDIQLKLDQNEGTIDLKEIASDIKKVNELSEANPEDNKLQTASGYLQKRLLKTLGEEKAAELLSKEDLRKCSDTIERGTASKDVDAVSNLKDDAQKLNEKPDERAADNDNIIINLM